MIQTTCSPSPQTISLLAEPHPASRMVLSKDPKFLAEPTIPISPEHYAAVLEAFHSRISTHKTDIQDRYPRKETGLSEKEFSHCDNPIIVTKEKIAPKIKRMKGNFRKAVDSGRKSGGGRMFLGDTTSAMKYGLAPQLWKACLEVLKQWPCLHEE